MPVPQTRLAASIEETGDQQLNSVQATQRKTAVAVNLLGATPNILDPITFTAGQSVRIKHKLGRLPTEWHVNDVTSGYGSFLRISWDDVYINIQSLNACTARFRVA